MIGEILQVVVFKVLHCFKELIIVHNATFIHILNPYEHDLQFEAIDTQLIMHAKVVLNL